MHRKYSLAKTIEQKVSQLDEKGLPPREILSTVTRQLVAQIHPTEEL